MVQQDKRAVMRTRAVVPAVPDTGPAVEVVTMTLGGIACTVNFLKSTKTNNDTGAVVDIRRTSASVFV